LGIGDWGVGGWAKTPTPNPQTQHPKPQFKKNIIVIYKKKKIKKK